MCRAVTTAGSSGRTAPPDRSAADAAAPAARQRGPSRRTRPVGAVLLAAALLVGLVAGCGPLPSSVPPTAAPSAPASPAGPTDAVPTDVPTTSASPAPFACGERLTRPGTVTLAYLDGLEATNGPAPAGRITFAFRPAGSMAALPEVVVAPGTPPFAADPSGLPIEVPGSGFLVVTLHGGTALDADFNPTFEGPFDLDLDGSPIVAVRRAGDFEGVSTWIIGLSGAPCARILAPDGTSRLVIEVEVE